MISFSLRNHSTTMDTEIMIDPTLTQMICYPPPPRKQLSPNPNYRKQYFCNKMNNSENNNNEQFKLDVDIHFTRKSMATLDIMDELMRRERLNGSSNNSFTMGRFSFSHTKRETIASEPSSLPSSY